MKDKYEFLVRSNRYSYQEQAIPFS